MKKIIIDLKDTLVFINNILKTNKYIEKNVNIYPNLLLEIAIALLECNEDFNDKITDLQNELVLMSKIDNHTAWEVCQLSLITVQEVLELHLKSLLSLRRRQTLPFLIKEINCSIDNRYLLKILITTERDL